MVARRQPAQTPAKRSLSNFHLVIQKVCASKALWQRKRWTHFLADQVAGVEGGDGSKRCIFFFVCVCVCAFVERTPLGTPFVG